MSNYEAKMGPYDGWFEANFDRHVEELAEFVSIPTIGAEPEHVEDMQKGAQWLADKLTRIGMENATVHHLATPHPVVTAEWLHAEGQPTVLVYGHFDVQPVAGQPGKRTPSTRSSRTIDCMDAARQTVKAGFIPR